MRVLGIISASAIVLTGCCKDTTGNRSDFTVGPASAPAYTVSEIANCPLAAQNLGYGGDRYTGDIAIVGTGPDPTQVVTSQWITDRLLPALRAQDLTPGTGGLGEACSAGQAILFVKIDNWFVADRMVLAIAAQIEADQLSGEVHVVIEPPLELCQSSRASGRMLRA